MPASIIRFSVLLLASLLVGAMFGIWLGFNPSDLSPGTYVEHQQHTIRALNTPMPILGGVCILLTIILAVLERSNRQVRYLLVAATVCLVSAGLITQFLNQPINAEVMTWSIQAPPANWTELRDQWWQWHIVRTLAGIAAMSFLILATLIRRDASK